MTDLRNSNCDHSKNSIRTKLKDWNCDKTKKKLNFQQNSIFDKTEIGTKPNLTGSKTQNVINTTTRILQIKKLKF